MHFPCISTSQPHRGIGLVIAAIFFCAGTMAGAFAQGAAAGTGSISGRVYNPTADSYVRDAEIQIVGTAQSTVSEEGGYYRFDNLPAGEITLELRYAGAHTRRFTANIKPGSTTRLELALFDEAASAQTATGDIVMLERFTVSGEREGNAKAFMEQKNSLNMKNVVTADTFGEIPEGNVAEFLQFMPGITVDYRGDDARAVSIRGLDPKYGAVTMDGARMASSSSSDPKRARQFEFEQVSINSIEAVEVNKIITAEHEADAAAVINMRSKSALDRKRMHFSWQLNFSANADNIFLGESPGPGDGIHHKVLPGWQFDYSNIYFGKKLGLTLTVNQSSVFIHGESYLSPYLYNPTAAQLSLFNPGKLPGVVMREVRFSTSEKINNRRGASLGLDYQATPALRLSFRTQWSDITTNSQPRTQRFYSATSSLDPESTLTTLKTNSATITQMGAASIKTGETLNLTPSFIYRKRTFELDGRLGYSKSKNEYRDLAEGFFIEATPRMGSEHLGMTRANANSAAWNVVTDRDVALLGNYTNSSNGNVASRPRNGTQEQYSGALNLKWTAQWKLPVIFKAGAHYREMKHNVECFSQDYTFRGADNRINTADDSFGDYISPYKFSPDFGGNLFSGGKYIQMADRSKLGAAFKAHGPDSAEPWFFITEAQKADAYTYWLERYSQYEEKVPAGYIMATTKMGRFDFQAGLRYEYTASRASVLPDPIAPEIMQAKHPTLAPGTLDYVKTQYHQGARSWQENNYDDYFLSAGIRWTLSSNLIARAGFSQSIHRPDLDNLGRAPTINDETWLVTLPNPFLRPEYSNNYSMEIEYYMPRVGKISASVFHNDIKDVQYQTADLTAGEARAIGMRIPVGIDPNDYWFRTTLNADRLRIHGFELEYRQSLTFLPGILKHTGVFASLTRLWFNDEVVAGNTASPLSASAGLWFNHGRLKLSTKGTWTDDMYEASGAGGEIRRSEPCMYVNVEASYSLRVGRSRYKQSLFVSGRNIFDERMRVYSNVPGRLYSESTRGTTWVAGIKGEF